jgi:ActD protein
MSVRRGLLAELDSAGAVAAAADALHALGYRALDTWTPLPLPEVEERLGLRRSRLGPYAFLGGLAGAMLGYGIQWYADVWVFPLRVGGRPLHAAPAFIPATFEATVLVAAFVAFLGVLVTLRLPELWHPVFEVDGFERASADRFWIGVGEDDPLFDRHRTREDLAALHPLRIVPVPEPPR